jgi:hypothetical protein
MAQIGGTRKRRQQSKRKQKGKRKTSRRQGGGNFGIVLKQALVPFSLLAMQQKFGKRKGRKTRKNKSRRRRR